MAEQMKPLGALANPVAGLKVAGTLPRSCSLYADPAKETDMKTLITTLAGLLVALGLTSGAQAATRAGVLRCYVDGGAGFIVGSVYDARCTYTSTLTGYRERYRARISRIGVDVGYRGPAMLVWAVVVPSELGPRALRGNYLGASADVAVGVGGGANVLIGGNDRTISLQPLSVQAERGFTLAAGAGKLELR
jgi:hypothetical protein